VPAKRVDHLRLWQQLCDGLAHEVARTRRPSGNSGKDRIHAGIPQR
jgi:hypothetical protein